MERLACGVFYAFSRVEECCQCSEVRFLQLFNACCWVFYAFGILYCCVMSEPGQQKHQSYRNEEVKTCRSKAPAVIENQVSFQDFIVSLP